MPILDNTFVCSNGHQFKANAKIRARCPECGLLTKRSFTATEPVKHTSEPPKHEPKPSIKHTIMLRQGKPRTARPKAKIKPPTVIKTEPVKTEPVKVEPVAKKPVVKTTTKPKVTVAKAKPIAGGLVKSQRIRGTAIPSIKKKPAKTAVARHIEGRSSRRTSYADSMIGRFGFGR